MENFTDLFGDDLTGLEGKDKKVEFEKQVKPGFTNYQPQPKYSWA